MHASTICTMYRSFTRLTGTLLQTEFPSGWLKHFRFQFWFRFCNVCGHDGRHKPQTNEFQSRHMLWNMLCVGRCPGGVLTARPTLKAENGQEIEIILACCFLVFVRFIPPTSTTKPKLYGRPFSNTTMLHTATDENKKSNYSVPIRDARHSLPCCLKIQPGKNTREKQTNTEVIQGTLWMRSLTSWGPLCFTAHSQSSET